MELIVVIAALSVIATAAISLLSSGRSRMAAEEAARYVARDLELVRSLAHARHLTYSVAFDTTTGGYLVLEEGDTLIHPVSKRPFVTSLPELFPATSPAIAEVAFGGSDSLHFAPSGAPLSGGTVTIAGKDASWRVEVAANTGKIDVVEN